MVFQYVTLHFRDQRGAGLLLHRNHAEINVLMCKQKPYLVWFSCRREFFPVYRGHSHIFNIFELSPALKQGLGTTRKWSVVVLFFVVYFFNSPTINSRKFYVQNGSEVVWSDKTVKWTYKYLIFAVDGGSPKRGDNISVTITFDVSCESTGAIVADPVTGDVFFRAPGLTGSIYRKTLASYNIYLLII